MHHYYRSHSQAPEDLSQRYLDIVFAEFSFKLCTTFSFIVSMLRLAFHIFLVSSLEGKAQGVGKPRIQSP